MRGAIHKDINNSLLETGRKVSTLLTPWVLPYPEHGLRDRGL